MHPSFLLKCSICSPLRHHEVLSAALQIKRPKTAPLSRSQLGNTELIGTFLSLNATRNDESPIVAPPMSPQTDLPSKTAGPCGEAVAPRRRSGWETEEQRKLESAGPTAEPPEDLLSSMFPMCCYGNVPDSDGIFLPQENRRSIPQNEQLIKTLRYPGNVVSRKQKKSVGKKNIYIYISLLN